MGGDTIMRKMIYGVLSVILPVVLLLSITVAYGPSEASASSPSFDPPKGRIVVLADDWTLGNYFDHGDADQFASNVFMWLTEHSAPSIKQKILVDEVYYNLITSGHDLEPLLNYLESLGYQYDIVAPEYWTPAMLAGYGAVLLERGRFTGDYPSTIVREYILDGGGALVIGGASQENLIDQNNILNWFGLNVVTAVIVGDQQLTDFVLHPVTQDVSMLDTRNPTPITLLPTWPKLRPPQILAQKLGYNWLAVWDGFVGIVGIDIKPGSDPNSINLDSNGVVPVAILSSASFDAATVDPLTVALASAQVRLKGKSGNAGSLEDVNGDGYADLVVQVYTDQLALEPSDEEAVLTGYTYDGLPIRGSDLVRVVPTQ
jgi:hypothetical protein